MNELIYDNYYSDLANTYYQGYMGGNEPVDSELQEKITNIASKYVDKTKVVVANLVVDGCFDQRCQGGKPVYT